MRITIISRSWPPAERSGVSLTAAQHLDILINAGHELSIIGSNIDLKSKCFPLVTVYHVESSGSGALYSFSKANKKTLKKCLLDSRPDLVLIESWQTSLTDAAVDVAYNLNIPILMVSHGVSLHPYSSGLLDIVRSLAWVHYLLYFLPKRILRLNAITTLDENASSRRFYDRDLAQRFKIPVVPLVNGPVNWRTSTIDFQNRILQVLVVGYFSRVKNQLAAIEVLAGMPSSIKLRFIGRRDGSYYLRCVKRVSELGMENRVIFSQDDECNVADEIANSIAVLCTSITEALPVTLIEAMASGTPFVSTPVGAIAAMGAGILANDQNQQRGALLNIINDIDLWINLSKKGLNAYYARFTYEHVRSNLLNAVSVAVNSTRQSDI